MLLPTGDNPYTVLSSELMHKRPYVEFYKDMVKIREVVKDYSYMKVDDSVGIVAINDKGQVALVGQWRYPIQNYNWEIPAGMCEPGESHQETAVRELKEEAGVSAEQWDFLGTFQMEASKMDQQTHVFLARKLRVGANAPMEDEKLSTLWLPFEEALEKIAEGEIREALSVIGLLRAQAYLRSLAQ